MVINAVIITDRLDLATLRDAFRTRVLEGPHAERFHRLRCRITEKGAQSFWEPDPGFDLARHIVAKRGKALTSLEAVQAYMGKEASKRLNKAHPRWQVQVLEGFEDDATALLIRVHHSLGDGAALISLLFALVDPPVAKRGASRKAPSLPPEPPLLARLARLAAMPLAAPGILLRRLTWLSDRSHLHGTALSGHKRVAWTRPLDLAVIKQAKTLVGATVNDVLMACVSGAFSSHLTACGEARPSRFLISMPVNVRTPGRVPEFNNQFAPVPLALPAGSAAHADRILAVKKQLDQLKGSVVPQVIYELQRALLTFLPEAVSRGLIDFLANKCTAVVTNVFGPTRELTLEGRRVRSFLFWVPQRATIGIGISILSFSGKVQVGVIADEAILSDPAPLVQAFEDEFEALKALA